MDSNEIETKSPRGEQIMNAKDIRKKIDDLNEALTETNIPIAGDNAEDR